MREMLHETDGDTTDTTETQITTDSGDRASAIAQAGETDIEINIAPQGELSQSVMLDRKSARALAYAILLATD